MALLVRGGHVLWMVRPCSSSRQLVPRVSLPRKGQRKTHRPVGLRSRQKPSVRMLARTYLFPPALCTVAYERPRARATTLARATLAIFLGWGEAGDCRRTMCRPGFLFVKGEDVCERVGVAAWPNCDLQVWPVRSSWKSTHPDSDAVAALPMRRSKFLPSVTASCIPI